MSWLSLCLTRAGAPVILYDMDKVDESNLAGQFYKPVQIGVDKTMAVTQNILDLVVNPKIAIEGMYENGSKTSSVVMAAFDSIEARRNMMINWLNLNDRLIFIDGRLGANFHKVNIVKTESEAMEYLKDLGTDDDYEELPCNFKQTSHVAMHCASTMTSVYCNFLMGNHLPKSVIYNSDFLNMKKVKHGDSVRNYTEA